MSDDGKIKRHMLPTRVANALVAAGINTLKQLKEIISSNKKVRGINIKGREEIKKYIDKK